jgi:hypothetical protein
MTEGLGSNPSAVGHEENSTVSGRQQMSGQVWHDIVQDET